ncbi:MAG: beta-galactosidase subunit alpha, partial [Clostridia bacterium]|nr:beta-galactosidase subunit alpha [Clostridia bacterium]
LPRYGLSVNLDKSLQNVTYYGLGKGENLNDFREHSILGIYEATVPELNVDYIRPQENGNHGECRYVAIKDDEGKGIMIHCRKNFFSFSAHNYSNKTLRKAKHLEDIKDDGLVCLNIDGFMRGTGTNSCGPNPLKQYRIDFKDELSFSFYIIPLM